jgi:hypothetical protein
LKRDTFDQPIGLGPFPEVSKHFRLGLDVRRDHQGNPNDPGVVAVSNNLEPLQETVSRGQNCSGRADRMTMGNGPPSTLKMFSGSWSSCATASEIWFLRDD